MGYIKNSTNEIGNVVTTTREHSSLLGKFTKGSIVKIIDINPISGYTIEDENGNRISEIGWTI